ncbi:MAG: ribosome maturation factor RimP [Thermoleophilia bacterium]
MKLTEDWVQEVLDRELGDVELVLLEQAGSARRRIVRLFVDHPEGVTHELCARVSGVVGRELDEAGFSEGPYTLEVSSPGVERPLRRRSHFEQQLGEQVLVKTYAPVEGRKSWQGLLQEVQDEAVVLEADGLSVAIEFENIAKANLVFEF